MHICAYLSVFVCICLYIYIYIYTYIHTHTYTYTYFYTYIYKYTYRYVCMRMYICMFIYIERVYMNVCIFIYILYICVLLKQHDTKRNPWVVWCTHIAQLMTHTTNVYMASAYLEIMLLGLLAHCR